MSRARESKALKSIQETSGKEILSALVLAAGPTLNAAAPRLRGIAAAAIVNLVAEDACTPDVLRPVLRPLLEALFGIVRDVQQKSVLEVRPGHPPSTSPPPSGCAQRGGWRASSMRGSPARRFLPAGRVPPPPCRCP